MRSHTSETKKKKRIWKQEERIEPISALMAASDRATEKAGPRKSGSADLKTNLSGNSSSCNWSQSLKGGRSSAIAEKFGDSVWGRNGEIASLEEEADGHGQAKMKEATKEDSLNVLLK